MKGVGGPLLCIGDLLSDLGEKEDDVVRASDHHPSHKEAGSPSSSSIPDSGDTLQSSLDLTKLFQVLFFLLSSIVCIRPTNPKCNQCFLILSFVVPVLI